jgi:hypothetical protein
VPSWAEVASFATAGGTLVLAAATFASVRSANRAARVAEESLLASVRPLLVPTRLEDPPVKVGFADNHWVRTPGGSATIEQSAEASYLTMSLRNVGSGIAVLHGWRLEPNNRPFQTQRPPLDAFRRLTRDLYIAPTDIGFWQGAIRDRRDPEWSLIAHSLAARERVVIDVLYGDHQGGQRVISRFALQPRPDDSSWILSVAHHWNVDRPDPR